jgi:hypothetical protein
MFISLPLCRHAPWPLKGSPFLESLQREMRKGGIECRNGAGIFCTNFCSNCGDFKACKKVWCGKCYIVSIGDPFPIQAPVDEDGFENIVAGDEDRFKRGRNGNNLMTPFQCDKCQFINMQKMNPSLTSQKDQYLMKLIRRANLDACWAREPSLVASNLGQARKMEMIGEEIGLDSVGPKMGPFPVKDTFGT